MKYTIGKKEFVVLSWDDYMRIQEMLEDYEDLKELRRSKEEAKGQKTITFEKAVKSLKLKK
ncbi:MAG: type II toxin-antitoxin system Phd/YefM family antitoxin [bacterium]